MLPNIKTSRILRMIVFTISASKSVCKFSNHQLYKIRKRGCAKTIFHKTDICERCGRGTLSEVSRCIPNERMCNVWSIEISELVNCQSFVCWQQRNPHSPFRFCVVRGFLFTHPPHTFHPQMVSVRLQKQGQIS